MVSFDYLDLLVFYCCVTNYYKFSGLKNIRLFAHCSVGQKSGTVLLCFQLRVLQCQNQGVSLTEFSSWTTEKVSKTKITQAFGQTQFLAVLGLRSLFPCCLSSNGCSQQLKVTYIPCHVAPSIFKPETALWILLLIWISALLVWEQTEKTLCF